MQNSIKEKILELRSKGYNYNQIKKEIGCSKGTISYHCGEGQKEKTRFRTTKRRGNPLVGKIQFFCEKSKPTGYLQKISTITDKAISKKLNGKVMRFSCSKKGEYNTMFKVKDLVEKIGDDPTCYLTGRKIDLNHSRSYNLDHVVPKSRGGDDSLGNCQIACREANFAKGDLSYDEFIQLCKEVLEHHENKLSKN
jgi:HNH endonuclease